MRQFIRTKAAFAGMLAIQMVTMAQPGSGQVAMKQQQQQQSAPAAKTPPPSTEDRPYDAQIFRLAEILGALHYLRELCGANEGQVWREQMRELVTSEGTTALRRAKLVENFNRGYRSYSRTYRSCTPLALTAI